MNPITKNSFLQLVCLLGNQAFSQVVTYTPNYVTANDSITIIFNASQGNGALAGADSVWIHTGLITDRSANLMAIGIIKNVPMLFPIRLF
jgi:hypothetical protein